MIELLAFLALSCINCLCILEINSLPIVSFAIICSHSEGGLFTLLIVSFAVQNLLSLIRFPLFTFVFIYPEVYYPGPGGKGFISDDLNEKDVTI